MELPYRDAQRYHKNHNHPSFLVEKGKGTVLLLCFPRDTGGMFIK